MKHNGEVHLPNYHTLDYELPKLQTLMIEDFDGIRTANTNSSCQSVCFGQIINMANQNLQLYLDQLLILVIVH